MTSSAQTLLLTLSPADPRVSRAATERPHTILPAIVAYGSESLYHVLKSLGQPGNLSRYASTVHAQIAAAKVSVQKLVI